MADSATGLRSLRRRNLREESVEVLRTAILSGELEPGSIHSAVTLAERLGVSPTPVREAMLELSRYGLLEVLPNRGFQVTVLDDHDLDQIHELRMLLEVPAVALAVARAGDDELAALDGPLREIEAAAAASDVPAFMLADRRFHLTLMAAAGNPRLVKILEGLVDQSRLAGPRASTDGDQLQTDARECRQLVEAVRARDATEAERLMHLQVGRCRVAEPH